MDSIEKIQDSLKKVLKEKRWHHTIGVQYTAQAMAMAYGEDVVKAGYGGVLHDCAKCLDDETMIRECRKNGLLISETERKNPSLLHAKLGACYAQKKYGITDKQVIEAIRWHTTGKPSMSRLEKIIYIADYIEPHRKMLPNMVQIRESAFRDLDKTMYLILESTISYLRSCEENAQDGMDLHTLEAYEYYKKYMV